MNWIVRHSTKTWREFRRALWLRSSAGIDNQRQLLKLKDCHAGRRCFVMANGPSLLKCDLTLLKNEVTIASNAQFLIWKDMGFIPTFLTVEDQLVAEDRADELNAIKGLLKIFPLDLDYRIRKDPHTIFINFVRQYESFPQFSDSFEKIVYWGGTVSFLNLQLAYYLGCKEIYLIGFDHNYKVTEKIENHVIVSDKDDVNHVHPDYFGKGYRWHDPNVARMERSYLAARSFLESHGIRTMNATVGGHLEVFPRTSYTDLFRRHM